MQVKFMNAWFSPDGRRYRTNQNPHEVEDEMLPFLPSSAFVDGVRVSELRKKKAEPVVEKDDDDEPVPSSKAPGVKLKA